MSVMQMWHQWLQTCLAGTARINFLPFSRTGECQKAAPWHRHTVYVHSTHRHRQTHSNPSTEDPFLSHQNNTHARITPLL